jgi:hypothetical protein
MPPLRCHTTAGILLVLVAATFLVLPAHSFSLDYLNVRIVFPYRGFNFNRLVRTLPLGHHVSSF